MGETCRPIKSPQRLLGAAEWNHWWMSHRIPAEVQPRALTSSPSAPPWSLSEAHALAIWGAAAGRDQGGFLSPKLSSHPLSLPTSPCQRRPGSGSLVSTCARSGGLRAAPHEAHPIQQHDTKYQGGDPHPTHPTHPDPFICLVLPHIPCLSLSHTCLIQRKSGFFPPFLLLWSPQKHPLVSLTWLDSR